MTDSRHYKAFISYSHSDEHWARWLQRALEKYKLPKTFRQSHPELPARLYPIFRDRDELASGGELSESIRKAMEDSDALIVICSPAARASLWVNEEIRRFRASNRGHRIFCLLVAGSPDPNSSECAFPAALLHDDDGTNLHEPLAADATTGGDGKRNAMLKIAAGLLGVGVDDLKRRDAQRQARFWSTVAFGALFIASLTIGLAIYAFNAKKESEMRRQQAEGLIGFMLGDLRKKLEPIGKLELLDSVGDQAMSYFATLGDRGTPKELLERAKALKQIGEVRKAKGELEPALRAFEQSLAQAKALYKIEPNNNDYLFELGQSEFWVGYVAWERGDLNQAETTFQNYMQYSRELLARDPSNSDYNMELSYAYSNLGSLARARGNSQVALENFILCRDINAAELKKQPENTELLYSLAEAWSWIGSTKQDMGDLKGSEQAFAEISTLLQPIYEKAENARTTFTLASNMLFQSEAKLNLGNTIAARDLNAKSISILAMLIAKDPQNTNWFDIYNKSRLIKLSIISANNWNASNDAELTQLLESARKLYMQDTSISSNKIRLASILREKAIRALHAGNFTDALYSAKSSHTLMLELNKKSTKAPQLIVTLAKSSEVLGSALLASHQVEAAELIWNDTATLLDKQAIRVFDFYPVRRQLALDLRQTEKAKEIENELTKAGYSDPRMDPAFTLSGEFR
jgi:eukaryotic-like serine/threonine-protein kinase